MRARRRPAKSKARRRPARATAERDEHDDAALAAKVDAAARHTRGSPESDERDAMVALIVVRAIERARELAAVEGGGLALKRALNAAEKPMAAFVERHLARERRERRRKA